MSLVHQNLKTLKYRSRLGSLQENPQIIRKDGSSRKRIFSDTDTKKAIKTENNVFEAPKILKTRQPLQDIKNKNLGAIPKVKTKSTKDTKHKNQYEKPLSKNVSKIQTPKIPKPKKISKSTMEDDDGVFSIPKFVTAKRGENNNSFLPDIITDSFVTTNLDLEEIASVQIFEDSNSGSNKENEIKRSFSNNRNNLKRTRNIVDNDQVLCNQENIVVKRKCRTSNQNHDSLQMFSETYIKDTISHYLNLEKPGKIFQERPILFYTTLNWLTQINDDLSTHPDGLLAGVLLFNEVLNKMDVSWCSMQLAGLACYRIIHKNSDTSNVPWSIILSQLHSTLSNLNNMEQNVLAITKFKTDIPEPSIFVYYYFALLNNYMNFIDQKIENCVFYIIESFILSPEFYKQLPSKIAAAAIDLALEILKPDLICWQLLVGKIGYYGYTELKSIKMEMLNMLLKIEDNRFPYRSSFNKYSRVSHQSISVEIKENYLIKNLISYS